MLFDDGCAHTTLVMAVVLSRVWSGQAGNQAETLDHVGDGAQVVVFCRCGVAADAVQELPASCSRLRGTHQWFPVSLRRRPCR